MKSISLSSLVVLLGFILGSCQGRVDDNQDGQKIDREAFQLTGSRAALLNFAALWCKPCRAEIPLINEVHAEFNGSVDVIGYLVEGEEKGGSIEPQDVESFHTRDQVTAEYPLFIDRGWKNFLALSPAAGKSLPMFVFVSPEGYVLKILQRSPQNEEELIQMTRSLLSGDLSQEDGEDVFIPDETEAGPIDVTPVIPGSSEEKPTTGGGTSTEVGTGETPATPVVTGGETPSTGSGENTGLTGESGTTTGTTPTDGTGGEPVVVPTVVKKVQKVSAWAADHGRSEVEIEKDGKPIKTTLAANLMDAWNAGTIKHDFLQTDMPFGSGDVTVQIDTSGKVTKAFSAFWRSKKGNTVCTLSIIMKPDGTASSVFGVCKVLS